MSRRSLYKPGRTNTSIYGPKTDTTTVHWKFDYTELTTTRDEEAEGPQKANTFRVKTWSKLEGEDFKPIDDGVPDDKLELENRMQTAAEEIANTETSAAASVRSTSEGPNEMQDEKSADAQDSDAVMEDTPEPTAKSVDPEDPEGSPEVME